MGRTVTISSNGTSLQGYLALPAGVDGEPPSGPGVVVVQEWWGLVDHVREVADRFAAAGYVALAPDFFHGTVTDEPDDAMRLMMGLAMDRAAGDIAEAAAYLSASEAVTTPEIAAVGFCMGGSLALWAATVAENVQVAVGFYPAVPWERMQPEWPNYAGKAALLHCSEEDGTSTAPGIQSAAAAIEAAGGDVTLYDYPGTHHAFFNDTRPEVHDPDAAALAWDRTLVFLHERLG